MAENLRSHLKQTETANDSHQYRIVEHDGGWAYKLDDVFSETFPSQDAAIAAARRAAMEQQLPGETRGISWEDKNGKMARRGRIRRRSSDR